MRAFAFGLFAYAIYFVVYYLIGHSLCGVEVPLEQVEAVVGVERVLRHADSELASYRTAVHRFLSPENKGTRLDKLVTMAADPTTRWHGLYQLVPGSDEDHAYYDRTARPQLASELTRPWHQRDATNSPGAPTFLGACSQTPGAPTFPGACSQPPGAPTFPGACSACASASLAGVGIDLEMKKWCPSIADAVIEIVEPDSRSGAEKNCA